MNVFSIIVLSTLSWSNPEIDTTHIHSEAQLECQIEEHLIDTLISTGKQLLGTPYKYAGNTEKGIDCSGLLQYMFKSQGGEVARTSRGLAQLGHKIDLEHVTKGDLIFFKGRNVNSNSIGHVAYVIEGSGKEVLLLHATSRGVVVDKLHESSYYKKRILFAKRLAYEEIFDLL